jgi:hypothetical protein
MPNNYINNYGIILFMKMLKPSSGHQVLIGTEKRKSAKFAALTKCCRTAATKSLFLHAVRHKDAQSGRPSSQLAIYNKCEAMLMMTYGGTTDYTCNS